MSATIAVDRKCSLQKCFDIYGDDEFRFSKKLLASQPQVAAMLEQLYNSVYYHLSGTEFDYQLVLLEEDEAIQKRLLVLSRWCDAFLFAFGIVCDTHEQLNDEVADLLQDIISMSRIDCENVTNSEQSEQDYNELIEFLRMAVIHIHSEFQSL